MMFSSRTSNGRYSFAGCMQHKPLDYHHCAGMKTLQTFLTLSFVETLSFWAPSQSNHLLWNLFFHSVHCAVHFLSRKSGSVYTTHTMRVLCVVYAHAYGVVVFFFRPCWVCVHRLLWKKVYDTAIIKLTITCYGAAIHERICDYCDCDNEIIVITIRETAFREITKRRKLSKNTRYFVIDVCM